GTPSRNESLNSHSCGSPTQPAWFLTQLAARSESRECARLTLSACVRSAGLSPSRERYVATAPQSRLWAQHVLPKRCGRLGLDLLEFSELELHWGRDVAGLASDEGFGDIRSAIGRRLGLVGQGRNLRHADVRPSRQRCADDSSSCRNQDCE